MKTNPYQNVWRLKYMSYIDLCVFIGCLDLHFGCLDLYSRCADLYSVYVGGWTDGWTDGQLN